MFYIPTALWRNGKFWVQDHTNSDKYNEKMTACILYCHWGKKPNQNQTKNMNGDLISTTKNPELAHYKRM